MNTFELVDLLKKDKVVRKSFCGVVPIDLLPIHQVRRNCSFIINTDISSEPGEHWFALYVPKNSPVEYFDSYGRKPQNQKIFDFINANGRRFKYNKIVIQGGKSKNCGLYSLFFIYYRTKGFTLKEFQNLFTSNYKNNDNIIENLYNRMIKIKK